MGVCPHRGEEGAGFLFFIWERFAGMEGTRGLVSKTVSLSSRTLTDSDMASGTWRFPRAVCGRAVETCTGQVPWPCGGDSGAHSALFARSCGGI